VLLPVALAGLKARSSYAVHCLLDLDHAGSEAANRFSTKGLFALLRTALETQPRIFDCLWQLPAAADLSGEDLTVLLRSAVKCGVCSIVHNQLQQHNAWGDVDERVRVYELLKLSVQQGTDCQVFCASPYAVDIDAETVWHLLQESVAVRTRHHRNLQALLQLPAAAQLSSQRIMHLMTSAISIARLKFFGYHPEVPAAAAAASTAPVEPGVIGELGRQMQGLDCSSSAAGVQTTGNCLSVLCQWKGAAAIGAASLLQLLRTACGAAQCESAAGRTTWAADKAVLLQLCSSKAAASISSAEQLQPLLQIALSCRDTASVKALLQCPGAAGITPAILSDLVQSISARWPPQWSTSKTGSAAAAGVAGAPAAASGHPMQQQCEASAEKLVQLLWAAAQQGDSARLATLCSYPAASQIGTILELLLEAARFEKKVARGVSAMFSCASGRGQSHQVAPCFVAGFTQLQKAAFVAGSAAPITGRTSKKARKPYERGSRNR
jgi:hypothetical protein